MKHDYVLFLKSLILVISVAIGGGFASTESAHEDPDFVPRPRKVSLKIQAVSATDGAPFQHYVLQIPAANERHWAVTVDRADGVYSSSNTALLGAPEFLAVVTVPGFGRAEMRIVPTGMDGEVHQIPVERGKAMSGWIRYEDKRPAFGAKILFGKGWKNDTSNTTPMAVTDNRGAFALYGVPDTLLSIHVVAKSGVLAEVPIRRSGDWEIVLPEPSGLRGRVTLKNGDAVANCPVRAYQYPLARLRGYVLGKERETTTDKDGTYQFEGLCSGDLNVEVQLIGTELAQAKNIALKDGETGNLDFQFIPPAAELRGTVWVDGMPASAGIVRYPVTGSVEDSSYSRKVPITDDGSFRIPAIFPGDVVLAIELTQGPMRVRQHPVTLKKGLNQTEVRFVAGDAVLGGTYPVLPGRTPFLLRGNVSVSTDHGTDVIRYEKRPGEDATFRIDGLPAGNATAYYRLLYASPNPTAEWTGHLELKRRYKLQLTASDVTQLAFRDGSCFVTLKLERTGPKQIWLMVFDAALPLPDFAHVNDSELLRFNLKHPPVLEDHRRGKNSIQIDDWPPLPPGDYVLVARLSERGGESKIDSAVPSHTTTLPFTLKEGKPTALIARAE